MQREKSIPLFSFRSFFFGTRFGFHWSGSNGGWLKAFVDLGLPPSTLTLRVLPILTELPYKISVRKLDYVLLTYPNMY